MLQVREYNISGNQLRAFYDENGGLVFVVDLKIDDKKPNVMLVINPDGNRKWDDILENDYDVQLEDVRPKKDNKYQKLDIEYSGLEIYDSLIRAYDSGLGVDKELNLLGRFRDIAVRRATAERLVIAETLADNARETINRANDTIEEQNNRIQELRARLASARKGIGKEPTKQSASKILRLEAQIDATGEKIKRTKKRLDSAQKRLIVASDDADAARQILERVGIDVPMEVVEDLPVQVREQPVANVTSGELVATVPAPVPAEIPEYDLIKTEQKAEKMADEDVKPLFDTDPEILDEEIAFKPIDFSVPAAEPAAVVPPYQSGQPVSEVNSDTYDDMSGIAPLSFTPPVSAMPARSETPVLDTIKSVDVPAVNESGVMYDDMGILDNGNVHDAETRASGTSMVAPAPDVAPAPIDSGFRPVSPITGEAPSPSMDARVEMRNKPTVVYYIMLVMLIVLSIFTLWFYQKSTGNNVVPNLGSAVAPESIETEPDVTENTDVAPDVVTMVEVASEKVATIEPEPEPVAEPEPEPEVVDVQPEPVPEPEPLPEPVVIDAPTVTVEPTEVPVPVTTVPVRTVPDAPQPEPVTIETEEEILAKKPAYGVSQNEAMFVAADEFETDRQAVQTPEQDIEVVEMIDTPVVAVADVEPQYEYEYTDDYVADEIPLCEGGAEPDRFGCCPGETYTQIDNGGFVCCPDAGGDCFPPLK